MHRSSEIFFENQPRLGPAPGDHEIDNLCPLCPKDTTNFKRTKMKVIKTLEMFDF
jgi:hypothetical protein